MEGTASLILFLCVTAIASEDIAATYDNGCPKDPSVEKLLPHENCNQFYQCFHGTLVSRFCPSGLHYNPILEKCDWAEEAKCHSKRKDDNSHPEKFDNSNPNQAFSICSATNSNAVLVAHENCNQFYKCSYGKPVLLKCAPHLLYNPMNEKCDEPERVDCGDRLTGATDYYNNVANETEGSGTIDSGNSNPIQAPSLCAADGSDGVLVAHENCNQFYKCFNGQPVALKCPVNLLFNPNKEYCDWPGNVVCGERVIPENDNSNTDNGSNENEVIINESEETEITSGEDADDISDTNSDPSQANAICAAQNSDGILVAHENCNQFYKCSGGRPVVLNCPINLLYNPSKKYCDWTHDVDCGDRIIPDYNNSGNDTNNNQNDSNEIGGETGNHSNPSEAPSICAVQGSDGVLVAHENCDEYYKCHSGLPVALKCPGNLLYNPSKEYCDWPTEVVCENRLVPEKNVDSDENNNELGSSDDSNETDDTNLNPNEAPAICAADNSDGKLIAHENCNQFYKCLNGKPIAIFCQLNLFYNPSMEYCDWPHRVVCGSRIVPQYEGNKNISSGDENSNNDTVVSSCSNSANGEIVPHENCSQFYKCLNGLTYPMDCPAGLYYNIELKFCDWPMNVECGDRLTESQAFNKHAVARRALKSW